jgi:hypothetical protein
LVSIIPYTDSSKGSADACKPVSPRIASDNAPIIFSNNKNYISPEAEDTKSTIFVFSGISPNYSDTKDSMSIKVEDNKEVTKPDTLAVPEVAVL